MVSTRGLDWCHQETKNTVHFWRHRGIPLKITPGAEANNQGQAKPDRAWLTPGMVSWLRNLHKQDKNKQKPSEPLSDIPRMKYEGAQA